MYIYIYMYMYIYIYTHIHTYTHTYTHIHTSTHIYIYIYMFFPPVSPWSPAVWLSQDGGLLPSSRPKVEYGWGFFVLRSRKLKMGVSSKSHPPYSMNPPLNGRTCVGRGTRGNADSPHPRRDKSKLLYQEFTRLAETRLAQNT